MEWSQICGVQSCKWFGKFLEASKTRQFAVIYFLSSNIFSSVPS